MTSGVIAAFLQKLSATARAFRHRISTLEDAKLKVADSEYEYFVRMAFKSHTFVQS
jgi:hypothetical protein